MKKISIIVPVFNEEKNLNKLFQKLLNLKFNKNKKEIVAINDGSTDNSFNILKKFKKIKVLNQRNQGKGKAVQSGISKATGEHVVVQDSDLEYSPKDIARMYKATKNLKKLNFLIKETRGKVKQSNMEFQKPLVNMWLFKIAISSIRLKI